MRARPSQQERSIWLAPGRTRGLGACAFGEGSMSANRDKRGDGMEPDLLGDPAEPWRAAVEAATQSARASRDAASDDHHGVRSAPRFPASDRTPCDALRE